ncbi:MAG TPA: DUF2165 domain-containing protein [Panacibacter sp.]|nr:DUF2165 domain-containing protein [Panacibacter sp.]HNP45241.1 DUF2165 domain-containing protein [Panacibacter sp.]
MLPVSKLLRIAKIVCVGAIGLMALLIVIGNITDYYTNYQFVVHVLKMDTVFPGSQIQYRHIDNTVLVNAAYIFIIALEALMAYCCIKGCWSLVKKLNSNGVDFHAAKNWAVAGIIAGIIIWFLGFEVIGGEWFAMWQSTQWNGLGSAERIVNFLVMALILLHLKETEHAA